MISDRELPTVVELTNEANRIAMELQGKLLAFFKPHVGAKVLNVTGALSARIADKLLASVGKLPCTPSLHVYRELSSSWLQWTVKASKNYGGGMVGAAYVTAEVRVGELYGSILMTICEPMVLKTDYTVEEVMAARKAARAAGEVYAKAKVACFPFGE